MLKIFKLSKLQIIIISFLIFIFCINDFFLKPIIKEKYLDTDLKSFEHISWRYLLIISVFIAVITIAVIQLRLKKVHILQVFMVIVFSGLLTFFGFYRFISNALLYINFKTEKEEIIREYQVINHKEQKVFWLDAGENSLHDKDEMLKLSKNITQKNSRFIFEYKNNDTVKVSFKKGILNVNYLD
ncbi:hypothetical protein HNP38_000953 [Chryseobacterium defluvii]|uniref:Uncharacterized protein n=1 Tax=Chryseobacterium defluvii TaxID=160396 RepID=A0A840K857_9FLAO|nr:hypothetical protein [Chryseobacterium defluvii]MBB4805681.1 hypothetical protein [Chryseobacterium defluvii]